MFHPCFPQAESFGWDGEGDAVLYPGKTIEALLVEEHKTDAHSACYAVYEDGKPLDQLPRLKVTGRALQSIRGDGGEVWMRLVAVDADRIPHEPWPTEVDENDESPWRSAETAVEELARNIPHAVIYATSRGVRVLFRLQRLVAPEEFRKIARAAAREVTRVLKATHAPLGVDETCDQWSRLFRLPMVTRDGRPTADRCYLTIPSPWVSWFPGYDELAEVEAVARAVTVETGAIPDEEPPDRAVMAVLASMALSGPPKTRVVAKKVYDGQAFFGQGERNNATYRFIQSFTDYLAARSISFSAEQIFSVLRSSVVRSQGTPPEQALAETWSMVVRAHARHTALRDYYLEQIKQAHEAVKDTSPIIAYTNKSRWVYNPMRRSYGEATSNDQTLLAELGRLHPTELVNDDGKLLPLHVVLRSHGVRVSTVRMVLGKRVSRVRLIDGTMTLEIGIGGFAEVEPKYHSDVAEYLETIRTASPDGELFMQWIATCHKLDQATTALLLHGASGAGKGMISEALGFMFGGKADFKRSMGQFNAQMLKTALIHLDEGVDDGPTAGAGVANRFREIVGGETISVEQKGIDPVEVCGNYRLLITSNNPKPLPVANTKSLEDFRAIASRVIHVHVPAAAREWLERMGGKAYTDDWIRRDLGSSTAPGKLVEHFSWMQANYPVPDYRSRFLVPSSITDWHIQTLLQGVLRDVLQTAITIVGKNMKVGCTYVERGQIFISADQEALATVKRFATSDYESVDIQRAIRVSLLSGDPIRRTSAKGTEAVFYPLPMDLLLAVAKPDRPDVFVEEAEIYKGLLRALDNSRA